MLRTLTPIAFARSVFLTPREQYSHQRSYPWIQKVKFDPLFPVAAVVFILLSVNVRVACAKTFFEDFENPLGTDNTYQTSVGVGNLLNPNFSSPALPSSWGKKSGAIFLGPAGQGPTGAFWMNLDATNSPTGYFYQGSFFIALDGLDPSTPAPLSGAVAAGWQVANLAFAKPTDWSGNVAAWRLGFQNYGGQLSLFVIFGWNSATNNPDATIYRVPIKMYQAYTVAIDYDNAHRGYAWSLDGQLEAAAPMPSDYPEIGTEIMGSSGSAMGHNTAFIIDNISWTELPGATGLLGATGDPAIPEPSTWTMMCLGFAAFVYAAYRRGRLVG